MIDPVARFRAMAAQHAGRPAVLAGGRSITYAELAAMAGGVAAAVARHGPGARVLLHLDQGAAAYAAMLGVLAAGGVYAPVNLQAPPARQAAIRASFRPDLVLTATPADLPAGPGAVLAAAALAPAPLGPAVPSAAPAYVIYTSGSTGAPKGVVISRPALGHYLAWLLGAFDWSPQDICSQHPNIGFDLSVMDIYGALLSGAALAPLAAPADRLYPAAAIARLGVTVWISVPSVLDLMRRARQLDGARLASLRLMAFCGEPLRREHLDAIFAARPDLRVVNTYGPTEATVSMTAVDMDPARLDELTGPTAALGAPIPGMDLLLHGEAADEGELVITGPQLADGYWDDPARTAAAFRTLPDGRRAYFTGDRGVRRHGQVFFAGRQDRQVKVHGYRLELDEVDAALRRCGCAEAGTILHGGQLIAFVVGDAATLAGLDQAVAAVLPPYAVPARLVRVEHLPRNSNDKIAYNLLPGLLPGGGEKTG